MLNESVKHIVKRVFPVTINQRYDKQTKRIMKIVLEDNSTFIDVGSHKGEILSEALKISPNGKHFAFEPIPSLYKKLHSKFGDICEIKNFGLSDKKTKSDFLHLTKNSAYNGIIRRTYPKQENFETIEIQLDTLDNQLNKHDRVDLIKIDVEGREFEVLKGSINVIDKFHPVIVFEHGLVTSQHYETSPTDIFEFFISIDYQLFTLKGFIDDSHSLSMIEFHDLYHSNKEYCFLAKLRVL